MNRRIRRGDPRRRNYWEEVVRRWKEGGRSVREFCRAEGLRESAFYFWRRKLGRRGQPVGGVSPLPSEAFSATPGSRAGKRRASSQRDVVSFLPVHVVEDAGAEAARDVEIVLEGGCSVRVPAGFDRQTLVDVLAVLEVQPC